MNSKISFNDPTPLSLEQLHQLEDTTGFQLSNSVGQFLSKYGGATIEAENGDCFFDFKYEDGCESNDGLLEVESFESIVKGWRYRSYLAEFAQHFEVSENYVEANRLFPLFSLLGSGQVYVTIGGQHDGKVYHVDNGDFGFCFLANSIEEFLNTCYID